VIIACALFGGYSHLSQVIKVVTQSPWIDRLYFVYSRNVSHRRQNARAAPGLTSSATLT